MREIQLGGKLAENQGLQAYVDDEDFDMVIRHRWCAVKSNRPGSRTVYAQATIKKEGGKHTTIHMHRLIMNAPPGTMIDHKDWDGLNNRRSNLRFCTPSEQAANRPKTKRKTTSRYKGVNWDNRIKRWLVFLYVNGKQYRKGSSADEKLAAKQYDYWAKKHFGEFASLNFPNEAVPELPPINRIAKSVFRGVYPYGKQTRTRINTQGEVCTYTYNMNNKWLASYNKKYLGYFTNEESAAHAYDKAVIKALGLEEASRRKWLNFPPETQSDSHS